MIGRWLQRCGCVLVALVALVSSVPLSSAQAADAAVEERLVAGLRERRLYWLAARHCEGLLTRGKLEPAAEAVLAGEWIRALAEDAEISADAERGAKWRIADETAARWVQEHPEHPRGLLVDFQWALNQVSRGELLRLEAELARDPVQAAEEARQVLRDAARRLAAVETKAVELQAARRPGATAAWTTDELVSLRNHVRFQRARSARNQGLSYPPGSPDRLAAVTQAAESLEEVVRELPASEPLGRSSRLELAIDRRLLGQVPEARSWLGEVTTEGTPPAVQLAARAELTRLELDANQPEAALRVLATGREIAGENSPELDLAHVETFLALWQRGAERRDKDAEKWKQQALESVRHMERVHGRYWGRRAEILLVRTGGQRGDASVEILRRAADDFFLKGESDQAIVTYEKGSKAAQQAGDLPAAFELAFKAALVEQQRQQFAPAAQKFRALAVSMAADPRAPEAHFLAIANLAQLWKQEPARRSADAVVLEEYLAKWPQSPSAPDVRVWLATTREAEQDWCRALQAYQGIDPASPRGVVAVQGAERCLRILLVNEGNRGQCDLDQARRWFEDAHWDTPEAVKEWSPTARWRLLAAVRLKLFVAKPAEMIALEQKLRTARTGQPAAADDWQTESQDLLVQLVVSQPGREAELSPLIAERQVPPQTALSWVRRMADAGRLATPERKRTLAKIQLQLLKPIPLDALAEQDRSAARRLQAQALFDSGETRAALPAMEQLAKEMPHDLSMQFAWGEMLLASSDRADWTRAVEHWRICAARTPPRSPDWYRAKLAVAQSLIQSGDKPSAAKLIRYLQATENLRQAGMDSPFATLLQQCESP